MGCQVTKNFSTIIHPASGSALPPLKLFVVLGEPSGDALAARVIPELAEQLGRPIQVFGLAGDKLQAMGLQSLFPISDIAVMGISGVVARLPQILQRIRQTADAIAHVQPDVVLYCDSPDFCIRVARRVRRMGMTAPQVKYICPSVWAWRPGRARAMNGIYDAVLAILPFEPGVMQRLGGPETHYVGHPLLERLPDLRPSAQELQNRQQLVVLPGSRMSEVKRLMPVFGQALGILRGRVGNFDVILPTMPHVRAAVEQLARDWSVQPILVEGEADKYAAFRNARAALAASGTVTLELALAQVPSVVAYRVDFLASFLRFLVKVPSIVLPNLIAGKNGYPEYIQEYCTAVQLADALEAIWHEGTARDAQMNFCDDVVQAMQVDVPPSAKAAQVIAAFIPQTSH